MNKLSLSRMLSQALMVFFISIFTMASASAVSGDVAPDNLIDGDTVYDITVMDWLLSDSRTEVITKNGAWAPDIYLPNMYWLEGSIITVKVESDWSTNINLPSVPKFDITLSKSQEQSFIFRNRVWRDISTGNMAVYPPNGVNITKTDILELLKVTDRLEIVLENDRWVEVISLPDNIEEGKRITIHRTSDWPINVRIHNEDQGWDAVYQFEKDQKRTFLGLERGYSVFEDNRSEF